MKPVLIIFFILVSVTACKKHYITPVNQLSLLPQATQTGARTFGCLINGQAFVPENQSFFEGPLLQCDYEYVGGGYYFEVKCSNKYSDGSIKNIYIGTDSLTISEGESLKLTGSSKKGFAGASYNYFNSSGNFYYGTSPTLTGLLTITKLDSIKQIVAGTFYFNVLNNTGDTVKITDGRFDMPYTR